MEECISPLGSSSSASIISSAFFFSFFDQKHERLSKCECLGTWGMERW